LTQEECQGRLLTVCKSTQQEPLVYKEALLPFVQRRDCDTKAFTDDHGGSVPLVIANQNSEFKEKAVWAVRYQNAWK